MANLLCLEMLLIEYKCLLSEIVVGLTFFFLHIILHKLKVSKHPNVHHGNEFEVNYTYPNSITMHRLTDFLAKNNGGKSMRKFNQVRLRH